jgi:hypothetical protein
MSTAEKKKAVERDNWKTPTIIIDESLNKYRDVVLFPEKLAKANETLKKTGHPEKYLKNE